MKESNSHQTEEVNKFNELASKWWDPQGPLKPLHELNPLRLSFIQNHVSLTDKKALDMGCGGGILTESLARLGAITTGIDLASDVITVAAQHAKSEQLSIDYQCIAIEDFADKHPASFDVITCMELLEHVDDPMSVILACKKLLKPHGVLFLSTLNRNVKSFLLGIVGAEYVLGLVPKGTHEYAKFIQPAELSAFLRQADFSITQIKGLAYNPLRRTFSLNNDCDVNYLVCAR